MVRKVGWHQLDSKSSTADILDGGLLGTNTLAGRWCPEFEALGAGWGIRPADCHFHYLNHRRSNVPTKPKKPARKPAAKKPAAVDYKKKYEALVRAAEAVTKQVAERQIVQNCDSGRAAITALRKAAGIATRHVGAILEVEIHNSPVRIDEWSDERIDIIINGKKLGPNDFTYDITSSSKEV